MLYIPNKSDLINSVTVALTDAGATKISTEKIKIPVGDDLAYPDNLVAVKFDWQGDDIPEKLVAEAIKSIQTIHRTSPFPAEVVPMLSINSGYFPELQASIILNNLESFLSREVDYPDWVQYYQFGT
ncbi:hypothetical protein [Chlorogloea sp. CCALA 695]|uniref:hypothetical protein n=1 Tax=Chlorogloea sp. CCALA 695 TaxID=2107693 RepID=UPI000D078250|nr:hypothetical protein [Chlorogloea sp. CCALA 695]PSB30815.1 hypothetical protein C7B70_15280 [Chlorogloea sp. CCALA 695]